MRCLFIWNTSPSGWSISWSKESPLWKTHIWHKARLKLTSTRQMKMYLRWSSNLKAVHCLELDGIILLTTKIALWYLSQFAEPEATVCIRTRIQRYNCCHGIETTKNSGYHETLTLFWVFIARRFLAAANPNASVSTLVNDFILTYGEQKSLFREYYSDGLLMSWKARQTWVVPDLKPFD